MSTFTLAIPCLTTSNLLWFMDLTFQVPMQYCSLQHQTLLLLPVTSTTGYCFCFGSIPSLFLELFLHWSPVAYWAPTDLGNSSSRILSFCLYILFMGFSRQKYWSGLPFPSPVDHILSDLSTMTRLSWAAPWAWLSFIELDKAVVHVIRLASFLWLWFQCVCSLMLSRNTYCLNWVSLTLDVGYLFTAAPAKHSRCSLPWRGLFPHGCPSWPWTWSSFCWPSCTHAAIAPWMRGSSSQLPPLISPLTRSSSRPLLCHRSLALLAAMDHAEAWLRGATPRLAPITPYSYRKTIEKIKWNKVCFFLKSW